MDLLCHLKHGFEPNALFADVALDGFLGTFPGATYCSYVTLLKTVLVGVDLYHVWVYAKADKRLSTFANGLGIVVVFCILDQLIEEPGIRRVQVCGESQNLLAFHCMAINATHVLVAEAKRRRKLVKACSTPGGVCRLSSSEIPPLSDRMVSINTEACSREIVAIAALAKQRNRDMVQPKCDNRRGIYRSNEK